jgi:hypothetical protein
MLLACGFGTMFNPEHKADARQAISKYNQVVKPPFKDLQHHFYDGDSGVLSMNTYTYTHNFPAAAIRVMM